MTFTYTVTTNIGKVRLGIGDTVSGSGVLPTGSNYSDEEIQQILTDQSDDPSRAIYYFLVTLANTWARYTDITIGPRKESFSKIAANYRLQADNLGTSLGFDVGRAFSISLKRKDSYQEQADA